MGHVCTTGVSSVILTRLVFISSVAWSETLPDTPVDEMPPGPEVPEKIKKRYRKKKTKLEEAFPTYLQVCGRRHHKAGMGLMALHPLIAIESLLPLLLLLNFP